MVDLGSVAKTAAYTGARPEVVDLVPFESLNILDVGCSTGALGAALKARRPSSPVRVVGIEQNPVTADEARKVLDRVLVADLDTDVERVSGELAAELKFDCMTFADVLEHIRDPWAALATLQQRHLSRGGYVVISLPNVGHYDTLVNVFIRHHWPRRDRGLHDETHVRWFARRDIDDLAVGAGLRVVKRTRICRLIERPHRVNEFAKWIAWIPGLRSLLTFQYLIVATPEH